MINAIIKNKGNTLIVQFPVGLYSLYEMTSSIGISVGPKMIRLTDNDEDDVQVKLFSENDFGKHLLRVLNEENSVADANLLVFVVQNAYEAIRDNLKEKIISDQYSTMKEVIDDIHTMTQNAGPIKMDFYCPLTGIVDNSEDGSFAVDSKFLRDYAWAIEEAIAKYNNLDEHNMAEYFDRDVALKNKLTCMSWGVELYRGRLFGKISCSLKEEMTDSEEEIMKDWIAGQNSDGWGEGFEQRAIDTEDGDLYVSFWESSYDYAVMAREELDEYIDNQSMTMGGM